MNQVMPLVLKPPLVNAIKFITQVVAIQFRGEELISSSIKTKKAICLRLDADKTEPRLVQSVHKGKCK